MGPFREIIESVYHFKRQHKQLLFNNAFQNISCFHSMGVQMLAYFIPLSRYTCPNFVFVWKNVQNYPTFVQHFFTEYEKNKSFFFKSTLYRLYRGAKRLIGLFWYQPEDLLKLHIFCYICLNKILKGKKIWIKTC